MAPGPSPAGAELPLDRGSPRAQPAVKVQTPQGCSNPRRDAPPAAADSGDCGYCGRARGHHGAGAVEVRGRKLHPDGVLKMPFFWKRSLSPIARHSPVPGRRRRVAARAGLSCRTRVGSPSSTLLLWCGRSPPTRAVTSSASRAHEASPVEAQGCTGRSRSPGSCLHAAHCISLKKDLFGAGLNTRELRCSSDQTAGELPHVRSPRALVQEVQRDGSPELCPRPRRQSQPGLGKALNRGQIKTSLGMDSYLPGVSSGKPATR